MYEVCIQEKALVFISTTQNVKIKTNHQKIAKKEKEKTPCEVEAVTTCGDDVYTSPLNE